MRKLNDFEKLQLEVVRIKNRAKNDSMVLDRLVRRHLAVENIIRYTNKEFDVPKLIAHLANGYRKSDKSWNKYY